MIRLVIKNCNGIEIERTFESAMEFVENIDSEDPTAPMLDDELISVNIDEEEVNNSILECVNDLYELLQERL